MTRASKEQEGFEKELLKVDRWQEGAEYQCSHGGPESTGGNSLKVDLDKTFHRKAWLGLCIEIALILSNH